MDENDQEAAFVDHGRNMICSPVSALMPLGKLALGAEGRSERELLHALGLSNTEQIKSTFSQLITNMEYLPGVTLDVASRIYVGSDNRINKRFLKDTKEIFKSSCQKIDTSKPSKAASLINNWIVEIPYEGEQSAMIIVLPYSTNGLPGLLRALKLAPELLNEALEKMKKTDLILTMPKFKIESQLDISTLYKKVS
ncbi:hypothetical protein HF086_009575 [Spodoptera exigua]|uniref:Serpin domain-containing protein n=1 Tax=Spodoptera exigua TaxID=7107 RepID=A0A922M330_SPOEX|nr:hypothetical protein HF086_009575 [Spodoptera exigua]